MPGTSAGIGANARRIMPLLRPRKLSCSTLPASCISI